MFKKLLGLLAKVIAGIGGKTVVKNILLDFLVKLLIREFVKPQEFAQEIHNAVQTKGREIVGMQRYESLEKQVLEPFAEELLKLWKKD